MAQRHDGGERELTVRKLVAKDEGRLVAIDEQITGRRRAMWYERRVTRAIAESDVQISLAAEIDGMLVGALLGSLQYGEFGVPEPVAVLDTVLVDPEFSGRGVARALLLQLAKNLRGLHIERLRTEVAWDEQQLLGFFGSRGFTPVPRLVLEAPIESVIEHSVGSAEG
ncbi:MAG: GNAT family N-acetyltransferase [Myxococcales bacterium]|nr:GNAT family N-acetyltransferase [Myxococcales bacterium]